MGLLQETQQNYYDGNDFGGYQFVSLDDIITNFTIAYVGENKIIPKIKRTDIAFHAQRAMQELSFDTFKSIKSQEITLPPSLTMALPQDYVNYTKICWTDTAGIEHPLYPTRHTSNPLPILQNADGEYNIEITATLSTGNSNISLDKKYPNIAKVMRVTGPSIPENMFIFQHDVNVFLGDFSYIVLRDLNGNIFTPTSDTIEVLTFSNPDGSLLQEIEESISIVGTTATTGFNGVIGENKMTLEPSSTQDISGIKEGMLVFSQNVDEIPENTVVTQVDTVNKIVFLSNELIGTLSNNTVLFAGSNSDSTTWGHYKSHDATTNSMVDEYDYDDDIYELNVGGRYGLEPAHAQVNGSYYIDNLKGLIHFSSNVSGKTVILKYISDGLGTDDEMIVHKFAEEAMYKSIAYAVLSTSSFGQPLVPRFKKEKFAAIRTAKLRLSNLKLDELAQSFRGKSKIIKH
jgi:hypothetical protein